MPDAVLSKYVAFSLNSQYPRDGVDIGSNLSWWQEHHPSWVLYRCDRKTPAFKCFPPAPCDPPLPLDITNEEVVDFQMKHGVMPAKAVRGAPACRLSGVTARPLP